LRVSTSDSDKSSQQWFLSRILDENFRRDFLKRILEKSLEERKRVPQEDCWQESLKREFLKRILDKSL